MPIVNSGRSNVLFLSKIEDCTEKAALQKKLDKCKTLSKRALSDEG